MTDADLHAIAVYLKDQRGAGTPARVVLAGTRSVSTLQAPTAPARPGFARPLNDHDVADVLTFIRNSWGNSASAVSADQIKELRKALTERQERPCE
jgi:mono/diheme cytochrome c family protein